jgi:uncharacterized membrane protein
MTFFRSFPPEGTDLDLPWPLYGFAYVIMNWGPISGGPIVGLVLGGYAGLAISLPVSAVIWLANAVLFDRFLHERIARLQKATSRLIPRVLVNVVAFAWAIGLTALTMFATGALLLRLGYGVDFS